MTTQEQRAARMARLLAAIDGLVVEAQTATPRERWLLAERIEGLVAEMKPLACRMWMDDPASYVPSSSPSER